MFAYLLIAIELVILYSAFWYIFIREPKPYKVSGKMWGSYSRAQQSAIPNGMDCCGALGTAAPSFEQMVAARRGSAMPRRATRHSSVAARRQANGMRYGWVAAEEQPDAEGVSKVISIFRNAFDALAVKLP